MNQGELSLFLTCLTEKHQKEKALTTENKVTCKPALLFVQLRT